MGNGAAGGARRKTGADFLHSARRTTCFLFCRRRSYGWYNLTLKIAVGNAACTLHYAWLLIGLRVVLTLTRLVGNQGFAAPRCYCSGRVVSLKMLGCVRAQTENLFSLTYKENQKNSCFFFFFFFPTRSQFVLSGEDGKASL